MLSCAREVFPSKTFARLLSQFLQLVSSQEVTFEETHFGRVTTNQIGIAQRERNSAYLDDFRCG
jgi:hypothetical protein